MSSDTGCAVPNNLPYVLPLGRITPKPPSGAPSRGSGGVLKRAGSRSRNLISQTAQPLTGFQTTCPEFRVLISNQETSLTVSFSRHSISFRPESVNYGGTGLPAALTGRGEQVPELVIQVFSCSLPRRSGGLKRIWGLAASHFAAVRPDAPIRSTTTRSRSVSIPSPLLLI